MQYRVQTDFLLDGTHGILPEALEQLSLGMSVKSIHNFIGKTHKTVNTADGCSETLVEHAYPQRKRGGIPSGDQAAALKAGFVEK